MGWRRILQDTNLKSLNASEAHLVYTYTVTILTPVFPGINSKNCLKPEQEPSEILLLFIIKKPSLFHDLLVLTTCFKFGKQTVHIFQ